MNASTDYHTITQTIHSNLPITYLGKLNLAFLPTPSSIINTARRPRPQLKSTKSSFSISSWHSNFVHQPLKILFPTSLPSSIKLNPCAVSPPGNMPSTSQNARLLPQAPADKSNLISSTVTPTPTTTSVPNKWAIVVAASIVHALHATCVYMGPATLMSPMRESLGLTVAQITQPLIAYRIIQAIFLIPAGFLLDATGPQVSLRISITAAAILAPLLPFVSTLPQLILLQSLFGCTKLFGGLSAMLVIITQTFRDGTGLATATSVLLSGYSFAGFLAPAVIGALSTSLGWRAAFGILSTCFIFIALPLTFHFLREPEPHLNKFKFKDIINIIRDRITNFANSRDVNQQQHLFTSPSSSSNRHLSSQHIRRRSNDQSTQNTSSNAISSSKQTNERSRESVFSVGYSAVMIAVATFSFSMHIIFDHLLVFLNEDFGLPFETATMYISALNLVALFAKLGVGPIADRYNKSLLLTIFGAVAGVASMLLLDFTGLAFTVTSSSAKIVLFIVLYSIGYASVFSLTTSILPEFGRKKLGLRSNLNLMVLFAMGSVGSYAAGFVRSFHGSYKWPFMWNAIAWLFVAVAGIAKFIICDRKKETTLRPNRSAIVKPKLSTE